MGNVVKTTCFHHYYGILLWKNISIVNTLEPMHRIAFFEENNIVITNAIKITSGLFDKYDTIFIPELNNAIVKKYEQCIVL